MTRMLASVRGLDEAEMAFAGGADIIDIHDAVSLDVVRAVIETTDGRCLVSAAAGDVTMHPGRLAEAARALGAMRVDYVTVSICSDGDAVSRVAELAAVGTSVRLIGVFSGDRAADLSLLPLLGRSGFVGATLDMQSGTGIFLDRLDMAELAGFAGGCRAAGMIAGLAGPLEAPDVPRLLALAPNVLGLRGGTGALDPARVRAVRGLIPQENAVPASMEVDYRMLGGRANTPYVCDDIPVDLVIVEDLVLPVLIGSYVREHDAPQDVRFAVTASVMRTGRIAADMCDVFSYDLITDGIRMLVAQGHVALVETLAERIAVMVLGHPRVMKTVVRVQKLETGSGTVGVEIERTRSSDRAVRRPARRLLSEASNGCSEAKS